MSRGSDRTNAMRILDARGAAYEALSFPASEAVSALEAAHLLGLEPEGLFKTLVTVGRTRNHYVFVVPATGALDLRKAARAAYSVADADWDVVLHNRFGAKEEKWEKDAEATGKIPW